MYTMAHITDEELLKLSKLSMLDLSKEEVERYRNEIKKIVDYVEVLHSVDSEGVEPTEQVNGLANVMRNDEVSQQLSQSELLKNVPATEENLILVKRVLN